MSDKDFEWTSPPRSPTGTIPTIRIQVEAMQTSILGALDQMHDDVIKVCKAGIEEALTTLPVRLANKARTMSEDIVAEAMENALKEYWNSGPGRDAIDEAISKKFKGVSL